MQAIEIIDYLRKKELIINLANDDTLELSPIEKISDRLIERLRKHKLAIIHELKKEQDQKIELIRQWLFKIEEPEEYHDLVIDKCKQDPEAFKYFLNWANRDNS